MMKPNINNDFNNYKPNSSHIVILPRGSLNDYNDYAGENQMYITFDASTGYKVVMKIPVEKTLEDLFKGYANKIDISVESLGKDIMFFHNGAQLDYNSKIKVGIIFKNTSVITIYDLKGIIGLWTINFNASTGSKISLKIDERSTIKVMMEKYAERIDVPKKAIGNGIIFVCNGRNLSNKQNDTIKTVLKNKDTIIVYDAGNVIGKITNYN